MRAAAPSALSISPHSGVNSSATFTMAFRDPDGASDIAVTNLLINDALSGASACYIAFVRASGLVLLVNDAGDAGGTPAGTFVLPGSGSATNSQCTVSGIGSSFNQNGGVLTLSLNISFSSSFSGNKVLYVAASDGSATSTGWQRLGVYGVSPIPTGSPMPVSMAPARPIGIGPVPVSFAVRHASTASRVVTVLMNEWLSATSACYFGYHEPSNTLVLYDNGTWHSLLLNGSGSVESQFCRVYGLGSSWTATGLAGILRVNIELKAPPAENQLVWVSASDSGGSSSWQTLGTWMTGNVTSKLELNLSAMPIDLYTTSGSGALISGCTSAQTVRQCIQKLFQVNPSVQNNWRSQGVTGVRFFFTLAGGYHSTPFDSAGNVSAAWASNLQLLFSDLRSYGITTITPTPVLDTWSGPPAMVIPRTVETCGVTKTLNFVPWLPYGLDTIQGFPDRTCDNQSYQLAARTPSDIFWGWDRFFNLIDTVLNKAQTERVSVNAFDYYQETNMTDFTVMARFIYDYNPGGFSTDVLGVLRSKMVSNGYPAAQIIPSANIPPSPTPATGNCSSYYGDSALLLTLVSQLAAVAGPWASFGVPPHHTDFGSLRCYQSSDTSPSPSLMVSTPVYHSPATATDIHSQKVYPTNAETEQYSTSFHNSIWSYLAYRGLTSNVVVFGETNPVDCDVWNPSNATAFVNGYRFSTLHSNASNRVYMRPWHRTEVGFACNLSPHVVNPPFNPLTF